MIRLRPYKISDNKEIIKWIPNEERAFIKWCAGRFTYPIDIKQLNDYYHLFESDTSAWSITALDEIGKPIGHFLMRCADYKSESIRLGFIIVEPESRGRGCGREMLLCAQRYAFELLNVRKITLGVFENNPQAHNCYISAGFRDEGLASEPFYFKSEAWNIIEMTCFR